MYSRDNINHSTKIVGIIGHPIKHSFSPQMHNMCFQVQGLNYIYLPFDVPTSNLKDALKSINVLGIRGLNVTLPHKEKIIQFMDHVSEEASTVGAVNTIVNEGSQLFGYNTDINGIVESLTPYKDEIAKSIVTVIGAGGAARSVLYALIRHFKVDKINIINRTEERTEAIKDYFIDKMRFDNIKTFELMAKENLNQFQESKLIINTTSIGMAPNTDDTPTEIKESFNSSQIVFDLIYNPLKTKFIEIAESQGAKVINGLKMFVVQGAKSFELWTGNKMDTNLMYEELSKSIK
ncbi:MAG: shikimate dehydrogenase [Melioribacteraceae bacterium]|nr:shikimate dehydrogenase [Melioribacteraceae bacterium]